MPTAAELRVQIDEKNGAIAEIYKQAGASYDFSAVTLIDGTTEETLANLRQRDAEVNALTDQFKAQREVEEIGRKAAERHAFHNDPVPTVPHPAGSYSESRGSREAEEKSLGVQFVESEGYKSNRGVGNKPHFSVSIADVSMKTTMSNTAGIVPYAQQTSKIVLSAQRRPMVADLIPDDDTTSVAVIYNEETTFTNAADFIAEAAQKPEAAVAYTQRTVPVEVLAVFLPVTRQQLDDVQQVRALIDNRLTLMIKLKEEDGLLNGDGASPHIQGILTKSGIQTQAKSSDNAPNAVLKSITLVRFTGFADPTGIVMHPTDWQNIRTLQTADGIWLFGPPSETGIERLWGLPVVVTPAIAQGTALTGDFQLYSHISRRMGIEIDVSDSHSDFFIKNLLAIRAEERLSLEIYRASAFAKTTGL